VNVLSRSCPALPPPDAGRRKSASRYLLILAVTAFEALPC
jgi:hypothetical protein